MPKISRRDRRFYCGTLSIIMRSDSLEGARRDLSEFCRDIGWTQPGALWLEDEVTLYDRALPPSGPVPTYQGKPLACLKSLVERPVPTYHGELLACLKSLVEWAATMGEWEAPCWAEAKRLVEAARQPEDANAGQ